MSKSLGLEGDSSTKTEPGDFKIVIDEQRSVLVIPEEILNSFRACGNINGTQFFGILSTCPSAIIASLGWSHEQFTAALEKLKLQLVGHVPDAVLNPPPSPRRGMGALPPPGWKLPGSHNG